jgi:hypothetical protein
MKYLTSIFILVFFSCNSDTRDKQNLINSKQDFINEFYNLSEEDQIKFIKERLMFSNMESNNGEKSVYYFVTDKKLIKKLKLNSLYELPLVVKFTDRKVNYGGNRFEDGGLDRSQVGRSYDYGSYSGTGIARDIEFFELNVNGDGTERELNWTILPKFSKGLFVKNNIGYHTNNLGDFNVYNFKTSEELSGLPGYMSDLWPVLEYFENFSDEISKNENSINTRNFLFWYNGTYNDKIIGEILKPRK